MKNDGLELIEDESLEEIVGGFKEQNKGLPTYGMEIRCPDCRSNSADSFSKAALYDNKLGSVQYQCRCGCKFVCYAGQVIKLDAFLGLCKKKGYNYGFA